MITKKFEGLIDYLSTRNGTCAQELRERVTRGELSEEEAAYVHIYSLLKRVRDQLDGMMVKVP